MVDQYLEQCRDEYTERIKTEWKASITKERQIKVKLPTKYDFSKYIKVPLATLEWRERDNMLFSSALGKIAVEQKQRLLNWWLSGEYNSTIVKLILSANHGMSETNRTDLTSNWQTVWVIELPRKRDD